MSIAPRSSPAGVVPVLGVPVDSQVSAVPYAEMPERLQAELAARVERLGYLGGFFSLAAHQPDPLLHFNRFTESLKAALPDRLSEVVALAAAGASGNEYELVQHVRLARSHGCADAWISAAAHGNADDGLILRPEECAVRALVQAAMNGSSADAELRAVITRLGEPTAIAVLLLLGRYAAHALMSRVLHLGPPVSLDPPLSTTPTASSQRRTT